MENNRVAIIIPAAGSGSRMKASKNKQFLGLAGKPVIAYTLMAFDACDAVKEIVLVTKEDERDVFQGIVETYGIKKNVIFAKGGETRQASVHNGIKTVSQDVTYIAVHDGARPFISQKVLRSAFETVVTREAVIVAVPAKDTIKRVNVDGQVVETLNRSELWQIQTPQVFGRTLLMQAYERADQAGFEGTDDSSLVEWTGHKVHVVMGDYNNIKVTTPEDLVIGEHIIKEQINGGSIT